MLIVDSREQWTQAGRFRKPDTHISAYLERHGIPWAVRKLDVGDYMLEGGFVTVDRKQGLEEVSRNLLNPADKKRFWNEVRLAHRLGIKLVVLVEDSTHQGKEDIRGWKSSYSPANGAALLRQMERLKYSYGVLFYVCHKRSTGRRIVQLLSGKDDEKWKPVI
jgi:hypothetical protein